MRTLFIIRSIFRAITLTTLLFLLFFVAKFDDTIRLYSCIIGIVGLGGMIILEIIIYLYKKKK
jgi:hypothetical protein